MRACLTAFILASVLVAACAVEEERGSSDASSEVSNEAESRGSSEVSSDASSDASSEAECGGSSSAAVRAVRLTDGSVVRGIPVAEYRHDLWWWDASSEVTYALFDPTGFSPTPGLDRSLRFVDASRIAPGQPPVAAPPSVPRQYRSWARCNGITLDRLPLDGVAHVLNGHERWHHQEGGFGDFAWDFVTAFADGATSRAPGAAVTDYAVWDVPVYLPAEGWVVDVDDSAPDNAPGTIPPGPMETIKNNMIGIQVSGSYYVYLLHFRQGSIPRASRGNCAPSVPGVRCIEPGSYLPAGTYVGRVGNSGVTYEPHLHVTAYFWDTAYEPVRSWSAPIEFESLHIRRPDALRARRATFVVPVTGDALSNEPF